ncbi:MAG: hypothetical protein FJZ75_07105 [Bacteroidetes bacterium]|nr:hypothetical protein [Bacteroidota bacterium]
MRPLFLLLLAFVLPIANKLQAQTLQFSQVLLVSTTQTVPANKVWKVEGIIPTSAIDNYYISINSSLSHIARFDNVKGALPIWLPAGTTLAAGANVFRVSVIEFTIVP